MNAARGAKSGRARRHLATSNIEMMTALRLSRSTQ
jgi:hypothetical protein